ncbi:hypothetical protein [Kribbia dieselivorans]|uniref:hypothetical protein n=1 Tax=Kribbia dieselivorans TaxID=331526 RepID=UPI0008395A09|nr:hypothetical protein [Kribbia dieselivorans]
MASAFMLAAAPTADAEPGNRVAVPPTAVVPHPVTLDTDPATLTYSREARSPWKIEIDRKSNSMIARHEAGAALHIDYDDQLDDRRFPGIAPDTGCGVMEGEFWGSLVPLLYPILDPAEHQIEDVIVAARRDGLRVRMSGGSYEILKPGGGSEPFFMDALFTMDDGRLRAKTSGLHYIMPSKDPRTDVVISTADGTVLDRSYTMASRTGREYINDVREVQVADGRYGNFSFTTDIQRLQIDLNSNKLLNTFELDMDHTFKDQGQKVVNTDITFAADCRR